MRKLLFVLLLLPQAGLAAHGEDENDFATCAACTFRGSGFSNPANIGPPRLAPSGAATIGGIQLAPTGARLIAPAPADLVPAIGADALLERGDPSAFVEPEPSQTPQQVWRPYSEQKIREAEEAAAARAEQLRKWQQQKRTPKTKKADIPPQVPHTQGKPADRKGLTETSRDDATRRAYRQFINRQ